MNSVKQKPLTNPQKIYHLRKDIAGLKKLHDDKNQMIRYKDAEIKKLTEEISKLKDQLIEKDIEIHEQYEAVRGIKFLLRIKN